MRLLDGPPVWHSMHDPTNLCNLLFAVAITFADVGEVRKRPRAGDPPKDFLAALLTAVLHPQRLLWSRQTEPSSDRTQSDAAGGLAASEVSRGPAV